jgi:hypothetical protein
MSRMILQVRHCLTVITGIFVLLAVGWTEVSTAQQPAPRTAPTIQGSVDIRDGRQVRFRYYFNHNALKDCVRVGNSLIALTESGNLIRFDAETLRLQGQAIIPGRGTAIAPASNRVLIGTEDGRIYGVDPASLILKVVVTVQGKVAWLSDDGSDTTQNRRIVAVVDNFPEVLPWPGEPFKDYDARSARLERTETRPYFVAVYANGKGKMLPLLLGKNFAIPNSYLLDDSSRLWMGTDKGEWGGECSYMDLRTGKVHAVAGDVSGVLGFLRSTDGRLFAYGGTSHLGMHAGYISQIKDEHLDNVSEFESNDWKQPVPEKVQQIISQLKKAPEVQGQIASADGKPQGPIDLMIEDFDKRGFWVISAHTLYRTDSLFSEWSKIVDLGGRWYGGRRYSVGNTPTVNRLIADKSKPDRLLAVMGRDGLELVSDARVEKLSFAGELESPVIEIWKTSIGTVFLADDSGHTAWRVGDDGWQEMRFFPNRRPSDEGADWYEASPFGDDGDGIVAFSSDNISPGERDIVKLRTQGTKETTESWKDSSSRWDSSFLRTSDGHLLRISGSKLEIRLASGWSEAGVSKMPDSDERKRELFGRRYVSLAAANQTEIFLDVELGELDKLTRPSDERYFFAPLSYKQKAAPTGVFDAIADSDGWVLLATAQGLFRLRLEDGQRKPIPSPSLSEEIKSICRDEQGRLWAAGRRLYVSSDEGKRWNNVELPMVSDTYTKRVRPNPMAPGLILALHDRGVVFLDW